MLLLAKDAEKELRKALVAREEEINEISTLLKEAERNKEFLENDKTILKEKVIGLENLNREYRNKVREHEESKEKLVNDAKEKMKPIINKLTSENQELKQKIEELVSQLEMMRNSIMVPGATLFDEFSNMQDNEIVSVCRQSIGLSQKLIEDLKVELAQKDFLITTLKMEKDELNNAYNALQLQITQIEELPKPDEIDIKKLKKDLKKLVKEKNVLKESLLNSEAANIDLKARVKYLESNKDNTDLKKKEMNSVLNRLTEERDELANQVEEYSNQIEQNKVSFTLEQLEENDPTELLIEDFQAKIK